MRINVYSQEIDLVRIPEAVVKSAVGNAGVTEEFVGVRFFLISPDVIHQTPIDDDQSAITFWLPKSRENKHNLANHFRYLASIVEDFIEPTMSNLFELGGPMLAANEDDKDGP